MCKRNSITNYAAPCNFATSQLGLSFLCLNCLENYSCCQAIHLILLKAQCRYPHSIQVGSHQSGRMDIGDHTSPVLENPQLLRLLWMCMRLVKSLLQNFRHDFFASSFGAVQVEVEYISYGPHGRTAHSQYVILPLQYSAISEAVIWHKVEKIGTVLPISTHLLSHLDDPLQVVNMYALPHAKTGDVIAIGETPLAIMQGRFRHPKGVHPGILAKLACRLFHPTSSLATACGMQALIDISGKLRVVMAVVFAVIARLVGIRGMFYRLAGAQARLIDDVTGTLPPYDQYITLGPVRVQETVDALKAKTGLCCICVVFDSIHLGCEVAVVDVNDLRKVQILAASNGVDHKALTSALLDNPAGNADEQTPLVLVRSLAVTKGG
ncbi:hypothetical protein CY35_13G095800 [Sphagnum magellanicum]|nr:hypothetical protein CY35_13G095800 [Sphagnum magellanicum]